MSPLDISLADLIARLDEELPEANELARISEARLRAQTLSDLGDQLIDHYVSKAKQTGASWTEIGDAIGVSKQAAQQRHAPGPFERYTELNRHSIVLAQEAARTHKHDFIGTAHMLLGLLGEPRGLAPRYCSRRPGRSSASATQSRKRCRRPGRRRCGVTSRSGRRARRPSSRHAARRPTSATTGSARNTPCWA